MFQGTAQAQSGSPSQALHTFQSIYPWILRHEENQSSNPQFAYWVKQYLAQLAVIASQNVDDKSHNARQQINLTLQVFRLWANRVRRKQDPVAVNTSQEADLVHTETVWRVYYRFLSRLLQNGTTHSSSGPLPPKLEQFTELKRVETVYENNVLRKTRFPKANETNREIENWVEEAFQNWLIFSGSEWQDEDLGQGGRNAVGHNMLDILYRAASKSFHSTLILRRLFQVHKSLTDFDLAYKALDTYIEIIAGAKTRIKNSGEPPSGIDSDDSVLRTISEGIEGLCCFGAFKEAQKANDLCVRLSQWVPESMPLTTAGYQVNGHAPEYSNQFASGEREITRETAALVHRALGIGKANWAYWTPMNEDRSSIQTSAIEHLRLALRDDINLTDMLRASFSLGLLLAETRDLDGSIDLIRQAIKQAHTHPSEKVEMRDLANSRANFERERQLIPLWHLLGLILSARQEFDGASRSCKAAFEQFPHVKVLFGNKKRDKEAMSNTRQETSDFNAQMFSIQRGLVDEMDGRELEQILEIRMTELALTELTEGSEFAINMCNELLSLFGRLFGDLELNFEEKENKIQESASPKGSSATARSFRGSIFGRKKLNTLTLQDNNQGDSFAFSIAQNRISSRRSKQSESNNPAIQVTQEDPNAKLENPVSFEPGNPSDHSTPRHLHKLHRREGSINKKIRQHTELKSHKLPNSRISSARQSFETSHEQPLPQNGVGVAVSSDMPPPSSPTFDHDSSPTAKQSLPLIAHNMHPDSQPPPPGQHVQPPEQDVRLPSISPRSPRTHPSPRFPLAQAQVHALALLTKTWLQVSDLYRRASLFDDAREAVDEAARHAHHIETITSTLYGSSSASFSERKWGGGRSSDELHAEVFASKGYLSLARGEPHTAMEMFEISLGYFQDCPGAITGLSECLLDIYEQKLPSEQPSPGLTNGMEHSVTRPGTLHAYGRPASTLTESIKTVSRPGTARSESKTLKPKQTPIETDESLRKTPANLNRIAARDRAYGLLSTLTKLGSGWNNSEAWYALARAHELGGEIDKAKDVLWWCVELEDSRPIRHYEAVKGRGRYVL